MTRDRVWCPGCSGAKWAWETTDGGDRCGDCDTEVLDEWPRRARVRQRLAQGLAAVIVGAVVLSPPAWAISRLLSGAPLYATRTVTTTTTQAYGILPSVAPALLLWALLLLVGWAMASGRLPRPP